MDENRILTITAVILLNLAVFASAARVGIVVDDGVGGVETKCRDFDEGATAYDVISGAGGFEIEDFGWGYGVCSINGHGCPVGNCFCDPAWDFWNFLSNKGSWSMTSVGVGDHRVEDGEIIGFKWGQWGDKPDAITFEEVCPPIKKGRTIIPNIIGFAVLGEAVADKPVVVNITDNRTGEPVKNAKIELFREGAGWIGRLLHVEADENGIARINIPDEGEYGVRITRYDYHHKYDSIEVKETTTTTTSSTTTTIVTTTTTTTSTLKHFITGGREHTTTTVKPTTTIRKSPAILGNAMAPPTTRPRPVNSQDNDEGLIDSIIGWLFG
ncbi:MAG: hypothetical protein ABIH11_00770 [Candidatus Altiarchaeota archaeon]